MEVSQVRRQLKLTLDEARHRAQQRRQRTADAHAAFQPFLEQVAVPLVRQLAGALKAEGLPFTVFTPGGGLRLAADRGRDDFIDLALDVSGDRPEVVARVSFSRGSRVLDEERPVKRGAAPDAISEQELLEFLLSALEPWLQK